MKGESKTIRQPRQERSIEKKNRIIEASYALFSEVGYYGTNTAEIAKKAGVSTGIVYGYFKDKNDILKSTLEVYITRAFEPIFTLLDKLVAPVNFNKVLPEFVDAVIKTHKKNAKMHEALNQMTFTDQTVSQKFMEQENRLTKTIAEKLTALGVKVENPKETVHFAMNILQSFSHEMVYDKHDYIDYEVMRSMVINSLSNLFNK